jgi:hypothetical protein
VEEVLCAKVQAATDRLYFQLQLEVLSVTLGRLLTYSCQGSFAYFLAASQLEWLNGIILHVPWIEVITMMIQSLRISNMLVMGLMQIAPKVNPLNIC